MIDGHGHVLKPGCLQLATYITGTVEKLKYLTRQSDAAWYWAWVRRLSVLYQIMPLLLLRLIRRWWQSSRSYRTVRKARCVEVWTVKKTPIRFSPRAPSRSPTSTQYQSMLAVSAWVVYFFKSNDTKVGSFPVKFSTRTLNNQNQRLARKLWKFLEPVWAIVLSGNFLRRSRYTKNILSKELWWTPTMVDFIKTLARLETNSSERSSSLIYFVSMRQQEAALLLRLILKDEYSKPMNDEAAAFNRPLQNICQCVFDESGRTRS